MLRKYTDLALEAKTLWEQDEKNTSALEGVRAREENIDGFSVTTVDILNDKGAESLCKPIGRYVTMELDDLAARRDGAFESASVTLADILRGMVNIKKSDTILVVGLGNRDITPDRVGPITAETVLATRHLVESEPEHFGLFSKVSVITPGVLGTTGIESFDTVKALCKSIDASLVIAADALCTASAGRLCRTVQITDTGITPGSGVGNARGELSEKTLGVPVVAVGVPTVMGLYAAAKEFFGGESEKPAGMGDMIVTPRDIDSKVCEVSRLVGYGINLALHNGLTVGDVDMLL